MMSDSRGDDPIIEEIWSWEAVNHGDSALMNKRNLGALCEDSLQVNCYRLTPATLGIDEWLDNSRDIINFLTYYLPDTIGHSGDGLPTHLPLIPQEISEMRERGGLTNRTLVAIGHSFGGCTL